MGHPDVVGGMTASPWDRGLREHPGCTMSAGLSPDLRATPCHNFSGTGMSSDSLHFISAETHTLIPALILGNRRSSRKATNITSHECETLRFDPNYQQKDSGSCPDAPGFRKPSPATSDPESEQSRLTAARDGPRSQRERCTAALTVSSLRCRHRNHPGPILPSAP